jgi:hypothetical protein
MRITTMAKSVLLLIAGLLFLGAGPAKYSEETVTGPTQGNHELNCTIIRPWVRSPGPNQGPYPVIVWANGWDQGNVIGENTTEGYKPGLIEWALDGPYLFFSSMGSHPVKWSRWSACRTYRWNPQ